MSLKFRDERVANFLTNIINITKNHTQFPKRENKDIEYFIHNQGHIHIYDENPYIHQEYHETLEKLLKEYIIMSKDLPKGKHVGIVHMILENKEIDLFTAFILSLYKQSGADFKFFVYLNEATEKLFRNRSTVETNMIDSILENSNQRYSKLINSNIWKYHIDITYYQPLKGLNDSKYNIYTKMHHNIRRKVIKETVNEIISPNKFIY